MNKLDTVKSILKSRRYKTNCFSFYDEVIEWIESKKADVYIEGEDIFLFLKDNSIYKFYYFVKNLENIKDASKYFDKYKKLSRLSLEFTTKNGRGVEEISKIIKPLKFDFYAKFVRMISGGNKLETEQDRVKYKYKLATMDDIDELLEIIHEAFDEVIDYIPTREKLISYIENKNIILDKEEGRIVFFNIYVYTDKMIYSPMFWIDKKYRKPKYTVEFYGQIAQFVKEFNIDDIMEARSYFWVDIEKKAYKIHKISGAKEDGLECSIFEYKQEEGLKIK